MTEQLAPGITVIPTSRGINVFLVEGAGGLILIDAGWAAAPAEIAAALAERGRSLIDIRRIVLTHAHPDHVQGAAELKGHTGAELLIHQADAAWLVSGRVPWSGRSGMLGRVIDRLPKLHWKPVTPDRLLAGGDLVDGLRVIHTPGHSPGHIALHHESSRTLLAGDLVFNRGRELGIGPAALASDPTARPASLARLPLDVDAVGIAHGKSLRGEDVDRYVRLVEKLTARG
jgi:glyoxylase-like metal-dependent hydrolase (beta-lactamase superfamily II)